MGYVHLTDTSSPVGDLNHEFRGNHRALCAQFEIRGELAPEKLKAAVHVTDPDSKYEPHQGRPAPPVDPPHQTIGALEAAARHDLKILHHGQESRNFPG